MRKARLEKECPDCKRILPREEFGKGKKTSLGNWTRTVRCKACFVKHRTSLHVERVTRAVLDLGMELRCSICGYDKCVSSLDFHHVDPDNKESGVGQMRGHSYQRIKDEISKCVILCKNCHSEVHAGVTII